MEQENLTVENVQQDENNSPKKKGGRKIKLTSLFLLIFIALVWYGLLREVPLKFSPETSFITEPLTADGKELDYYKALTSTYPEGMKTDENGARLVIREIGRFPFGSEVIKNEQHRNEFYNTLDLDPKAEPKLFFEDYLVQYRIKLDKDLPGEENDGRRYEKYRVCTESISNRNWDHKILPEEEHASFLEDWVKKNGAAIDLMAKAVRCKIFQFPFLIPNEGKRRPEIFNDGILSIAQEYRYMGRAFHLRANYRLSKGDIDGAIDDILSIEYLAEHAFQSSPYIATVMAGLSLREESLTIELGANPSKRPTKAQWDRLATERKKIRSEQNGTKAIVNEFNLFGRDKLQECQTRRDLSVFHGLEKLGYDWNKTVEILQRYSTVSGSLEKDWGETPAYFCWNDIFCYFTPNSRAKMIAKNIALATNRDRNAYNQAIQREKCLFNLSAIAVALQKYADEKGSFPPAFTVDAKGKPLHSWRVLILPWLGEQKLYDKIKLNEPWDSENNRPLHNEIPAVYLCPASVNAYLIPGTTTYEAITGSDAPFAADGKAKAISTSQLLPEDLICVTETTIPVCWMKPTLGITKTDLKNSLLYSGNRPTPSSPAETEKNTSVRLPGAKHSKLIGAALTTGAARAYNVKH